MHYSTHAVIFNHCDESRPLWIFNKTFWISKTLLVGLLFIIYITHEKTATSGGHFSKWPPWATWWKYLKAPHPHLLRMPLPRNVKLLPLNVQYLCVEAKNVGLIATVTATGFKSWGTFLFLSLPVTHPGFWLGLGFVSLPRLKRLNHIYFVV